MVSLSVTVVSNASCDLTSMTVGDCAAVSGTLTDEAAVLEAFGGNPGGGDAGPGADEPDLECVATFPEPCLAPEPGALTLSDIAAFRPGAGANLMEPNGWSVAGLPTNFYSSGGQQTQQGSLLGGPAEVRFTPVVWTWAYGDGASTRSSTAGGSWASRGVAEFDPTPTSHTYATRGTYTITLVIDYAAEYRLGAGPWTRIPGTLRVPSNPLAITVGSVTTVLVDKDCRQNPAGPGC